VQQTQDAETKTKQAASVEQKVNSRDKLAHERMAVDEAKRLLSEIAGVEQAPAPRRDSAKMVKTLLLAPLFLLKFLVSLVLRPLSKLDLSLVHDMRRFLASPGNFFWFNRLAPDRAAKHFRTTSTDVMTHHVRRYGAHIAMLVLALVVVLGGGFGKFIKPIISPDDVMAMGPSGSGLGATYDGDMQLLYISTIGDPSVNIPHRIQTYTVKAGDTIPQLAADNKISIDTLLYANLLVDPDMDLSVGHKLVIPPVSGMLHIVNTGDTIQKIAARYQVEPQAILGFAQNNLTGVDIATPLKPGQEVMVPDGVLPMRTVDFLYTVSAGDTVDDVATKFGITPDTILLNNNNISGKTLKPGQQITILPISGIEYSIKPGDTLQGIASRYSVSLDSLKNFPLNQVFQSGKLEPNTTLYLPDGVPPVEVPIKTPLGPITIKVAPPKAKVVVSSGSSSSSNVVKPAANNTKPATNNAKPATNNAKPATNNAKPATNNAKPATNNAKPAAAPAPIKAAPAPQQATGHLIWPIHGVITTYFHQYIWYGIHQGLDIATARGTPCVAADSGVVLEAGWNPYGYGISVLIDHGNGMQTRYGHFDGLAVHRGQYVSRGQVIGYEGNTGNSSGPHVHFEVHMNGVIVNPLNYLN
jgi:murein DD-endopeptidase MepM/ murein hydrolase activator NlpD